MKDYIVRKIKSKKKNSYTYSYHDKHGKPVSSKRVETSLQGLYIPPAHDNVKINLHKSSKVLAIGYDTKGRAQYIYNPKFKAKQSKSKFKHMIQFGESYQTMMKQIQKDLYSEGDPKPKQIATILRLVIDCGFRIGNEKYTKENKSFGVSTLESQHVKVKGPAVIVDFIGKKGVRNVCTIKHKKVSKELKTKKRYLGKRDRLFSYRKGSTYHDIHSSDVNKYLKQFGKFTTKNFRTWTANIHLIQQLMKGSSDDLSNSSESNKQKLLNQCLDDVAHKLHNTRSVCKLNYIDPYVMETFLNDTKRFVNTFKSCKSNEDFTNQYIKLLKTNKL